MVTEREEIELCIEYGKRFKRDMAKDMLKIFEVDDLLEAVIWKLLCNTANNKGIERKDRRKYIHKIIDKEISKWVE